MKELFDYDGRHVPASFDVAWYEVEEELRHEDWRKRASDHFARSEAGQAGNSFNAAIGALAMGASTERAQKSRTAEINYWESVLQLEHFGPND